MQRFEFIGNLTADPVQRETASGKVTNFSVAVDRSRKAANGDKITDFFRVAAWNALGESCFKWLAKGRKVFVEGELNARMYDSEDGKTLLSLDVMAWKVEFLSPASKPEEPKKETKKYTEADFTDITSNDIPF